MTLGELANLGEFVGGLAVLVTLIYLAVQIGGSKRALKTQTHHNLLAMAQRPLELMIADPELADIVNRGHDDPEALNPAEWSRYSNYTLIVINAWEYGYYLNRDGSTPPELWEGADGYFRQLAATKPGWRRFWRENHHAFAEPFHSYAETRLSRSA